MQLLQVHAPAFRGGGDMSMGGERAGSGAMSNWTWFAAMDACMYCFEKRKTRRAPDRANCRRVIPLRH